MKFKHQLGILVQLGLVSFRRRVKAWVGLFFVKKLDKDPQRSEGLWTAGNPVVAIDLLLECIWAAWPPSASWASPPPD